MSLLGTGMLGAQAVPQVPATTLKIGTREVILDVIVTDAAGRPVTTLARKDFRVYEGGAEQQLVSFGGPLEAEATSNRTEVKSAADLLRAGDIPVTILLLDELNTKFEDTSFGVSSATRFLDRQPGRMKEPTALYSISDSGLKAIVDYTEDRDAIKEGLRRHVPVYPFRMMKGGGGGPGAGERLARCLGAMLQIAQSAKGYSGHKTVVWIGKGFPSLNTDGVNAAKAAELLATTRAVTSALLEARVVLNIVDPTALAVQTVDYSSVDAISPDQLLQAEGANGTELFPGDISFASFAPATGGLAFYARNDVDREIETAVNDGAMSYSMSYSPTDRSDNPQKFRQIVVKVSDSALKVWTRTGYYGRSEGKAGEHPAAPPVRQLAFDLSSAALSSMSYSGLRVTAERDGDGYRVAVARAGLEPHSTKDRGSVDEVTVMEVAFGARSKVLAHGAEEITQGAPDGGGAMQFKVRFAAPAGAARVRLVVRDAVSGHVGTVDVRP